ncbi:MAG TPA: DUF4926 domain-containing protein [Hyphomicrobiaceae bacterium]|nr:DUF4926 domain-containing protein [Hyphomicrobiaceae bacterium]
MIKEFDLVVLAIDLPQHKLKQGDVGTVVLVHRDGAGYEVEFVTFSGETVSVVTLRAKAIRPVGQRELAHVREVA